jgi:Putative auto-transporter adhesin, head GIN domain
MTRTLPAFLLLLAAAAPAAAQERSYTVTDFDRIQVDGPYEVILTTGRSSGARAVGPSAAADRITVEVQGQTLRIHANRSAWGGYPGQQQSGPVRIEATTRDLSAATVIGAGSLTIDRTRGLRLALTVSGSGRISVGRLEADTLILSLRGSGRLSLAGTAKKVDANLVGSGDLDSARLAADDVDLYSETSGTVALTARRSAKVRAAGVGEVTIGGTAACTVTGIAAGQVRCGG